MAFKVNQVVKCVNNAGSPRDVLQEDTLQVGIQYRIMEIRVPDGSGDEYLDVLAAEGFGHSMFKGLSAIRFESV